MKTSGLDILERVKYEIEHNSQRHNSRTMIPTRDLEKLIDLAETNQTRISLEIAEEIMRLNRELEATRKNEKKLISLVNELLKGK